MPVVFACSLAMANAALAEQRYVVDTIVVSLREGPSSKFKAIKTVQTGQAMEVLESKDNFLRVRTPEGDEGWLPSQYVASQPTSANLVQELEAKVNLLSAQNEQLTAQIAGKLPQAVSEENESSALSKLQAKLDSMTEQYTLLEAGAKDFIQIQDENKQLKEELATMKAEMIQFQNNNKSVVISQSIYWFLAGGAVFFIGWVTGKISFRRQRHSLTL